MPSLGVRSPWCESLSCLDKIISKYFQVFFKDASTFVLGLVRMPLCLHRSLVAANNKAESDMTRLELIYNTHYGNGVPVMFTS